MNHENISLEMLWALKLWYLNQNLIASEKSSREFFNLGLQLEEKTFFISVVNLLLEVVSMFIRSGFKSFNISVYTIVDVPFLIAIFSFP